MTEKLTHGQRHMLKIIRKDTGDDGWARTSSNIHDLLAKHMPKELIELEESRVRLTKLGSDILCAMEWL